MSAGHPPAGGDLNLAVYLHVIQCDACTEAWGDGRILSYGQLLLQVAVINQIGSSN